MNKKMRELLALINAKHIEAKGYTEGEEKDYEKATSLLDEAEALQKEYSVEERLFEASKKEVPEDAVEKAKEADSTKAFAEAARNQFKGMSEGVNEDGGYTVPEDIATQIIKYRSATRSLLDLVARIPVKTMSGQRTFKKRSQQTGFAKVDEGGNIPAKAAPKYERKSYSVKKYAGFLPVTNELLADSDANIVSEVAEWLGDESRITANNLILAALDAGEGDTPKAVVEIESVDDIKKILNVTLGQAFKPYSSIVTNDNGLHWLDTLKDKEDNYLLSASPADPMRLQLSAGATVIPVEVIPNDDLPNTDTGIPVYIGDFKEAIKYFDREMFSLRASDVATAGDVNSFEQDLTLFRAIEREDVQCFDQEAYVCGVIPVAAG